MLIASHYLLVQGFLTKPVGFQHGLNFAEDGCTLLSSEPKTEEHAEEINKDKLPEVKLGEEKNIVNLVDLLNQDQDVLGLWAEPAKEQESSKARAPVIELKITPSEEDDAIIPKVSH